MLDKRAEIIQEFQNRIDNEDDDWGRNEQSMFALRLSRFFDVSSKAEIKAIGMDNLISKIIEITVFISDDVTQRLFVEFFGTYAEDYTPDELRRILALKETQ